MSDLCGELNYYKMMLKKNSTKKIQNYLVEAKKKVNRTAIKFVCFYMRLNI